MTTRFRVKYIIVESMEIETPVVFNELIQHKTIAGFQRVVGAGFCYVSIDSGKWVCFGESVSLGVKSREKNDADILNHFIPLTNAG